MTVHTDSTTASQSPPPLTSGEADLQRWGCGRWEGGEGGGGVIPSHGVVNVSAVDSERTEDGVVRTWKAGRERRMKGMRQVRKQRQGYRGMETDGWRGLVVEGGGSHSVDGWHASERGELRRAAPRTRKRAK